MKSSEMTKKEWKELKHLKINLNEAQMTIDLSSLTPTEKMMFTKAFCKDIILNDECKKKVESASNRKKEIYFKVAGKRIGKSKNIRSISKSRKRELEMTLEDGLKEVEEALLHGLENYNASEGEEVFDLWEQVKEKIRSIPKLQCYADGFKAIAKYEDLEVYDCGNFKCVDFYLKDDGTSDGNTFYPTEQETQDILDALKEYGKDGTKK